MLAVAWILAACNAKPTEKSEAKPGSTSIRYHAPKSYAKDGATWDVISVTSDATDAQLCELARYLRTQNDDRRFHIFTSPSQPDMDAFIKWTTTYPATRRSPALVAWMKKHHRGIGRPTLGGGWELETYREELPTSSCPI